ncbi:hypothetical protein HHK36_016531 [Tetracentron sinense]|uniref:Peptidase M1 leukotriene A4 hydrolase/aminopeptidase C-terminal domain-containing protein n=1 Tax=Tetracentron sinense TaxID=13715 RepID=A0A834Z5G0_TETSI|nr:hypothetical protein HHK36_016531 [Tetracentron sinense]
MAPFDPHSFTDSSHPFVTHVALTLYFQFATSTINASALFSLPTPYSGPIYLDSRSLFIASVIDPQTLHPIPFSLSPVPDMIKGQNLTDTPAARLCYSARLNVPRQLLAVTSVRHIERRARILGEAAMACDDALWCAEGRVREVGPRTRVYAESVPAVLDAATRELAGTEEMIRQGERLFGPYEWERCDLPVLPPSFPFGGMENPRMVFFTPTVIKGDASGEQGFMTYAERRIVEVVQGEDRAALDIGIGWRGLHKEMKRLEDNVEFTKLKTKLEGVDPDDVLSRVPYEKGFLFLWHIEHQTEGTGIPPDAFEPASNIYTKIVSIAKEFKLGRMLREDEVADWQGKEWELYLENLPQSVEASMVEALDAHYRLAESKDYEVKVSFLLLAILSGCREYYSEVERTLKEVGRMKYIRPLYTALVQGSGKEEAKMLAKRVFVEARDCYHPIVQGVVDSILSKHL